MSSFNYWIRSPLLLLLATQALAFSSISTPTTYCLSWDGVIADTIDWRIQQGIQAAKHVWPSLNAGEDPSWLHNKMRAIAPHLGALQEFKTVEYALLARLLIAEQQLDPSVGKRGKYASQYHPQGSIKSIAIPSIRSSRPLTVGEIQANWLENDLLDTLLIKYPVVDDDGKKHNPVPILQDCIEQLSLGEKQGDGNSQTAAPTVRSYISDTMLLEESMSQVVVTVPNESELLVAQQTLPGIAVCSSPDELLAAPSLVLGTDQQIMNILLKKNDTPVHFIGSSWSTVQSMRRRHMDAVSQEQLKLSLSSWTVDAPQQDQAGMDPYIDVLSQENLLRIFQSARTVDGSKSSS